MFHAAKDALSSRAAQTWVNSLIVRYGQVSALRIDTRHKTVEATCRLEGEPTPITIRIENYLVESEEDKRFIRATGFTCSRPWLQKVLADHGPRQRIELPRWVAAAL